MKKPLIIATIFGIIAALFVALYLNSLETTYKKGTQRVKVLVAKDYIDQGMLLDETLIEEKPVPKEFIQPKAISLVKELYSNEGRKIYITIVPFEKGEQITTTKVSILGLDTGISAVIPTQKRSMTLLMDSSFVGGIIKPGNRVDVIGILEYEDKSGQMQESAFTILQNVLVLATGNTVLGMVEQGLKSTEKSGMKAMLDTQTSGSIPVSVAVTPKEAEALALVSERGTIKLSLRPTGDDFIFESQGTSIKDFSKEISQTTRGGGGAMPQMSSENAKEIQKNQREVLELLRKYKKQ